MRITRVRIERVRRFEAPFALAALRPGLNLFVGPNEAGKSTIVRAIRAAFFERYRSNATADLRPWTHPDAAPAVEVDFECRGVPYELRKTFLKNARCTLRRGDVVLDGDAAETELAALLGFSYASRGASDAAHQGVPGLLWIEQGTAQRIDAPVEHASAYLRKALGSAADALATSHSDAVIRAIAARRAELLTEAGRPRGALDEAAQRRQRIAAELKECAARVDEYRRWVDDLAALRRDDDAERIERPLDALQAALREAQQRRQQVESLQREIDGRQVELGSLRLRIELLDRELKQFDDEQARHATLARRAQELEADLAAAAQREQVAAATLDARQRALHAAREAVAQARRHERRQTTAAALRRIEARIAELSQGLQLAERGRATIDDLRRERPARPIDDAALARLRRQRDELVTLRAAQQAQATRLRFELQPGARVQLGAEPVPAGAGPTEAAIVEPTAIAIEGVGRILVMPGATDLQAIQARLAAAEGKMGETLQAAGVESVAQAEALRERIVSLDHRIALADGELKLRAPRGIDQLRADLAAAQAEQAGQQAQLDAMPTADPAAPAEAPPMAAEAAEDAERQAQEAFAAAERARGAAATQAATAQAALGPVVDERDALAQRIGADAWTAARAAAAAARAERSAALDTLQGSISAATAALRQLNPELARQDLQRCEAAVETHRKAVERRAHAIAAVAGRLDGAGAEGLEEQRATLETQLAEAQRRHAELSRQAAALDLLVRMLREGQSAQKRQLLAPLQARVQHYLALLIPQAELRLGEDLAPGALLRGGDGGGGSTNRDDYDALSYGAREQMGILARLAYADLLREAGQPTLLILDDALVHTDRERLTGMHRILFDAASRHQVLVFTCHPEAYRSLGVEPVEIRADTAAAP